MLVRSQAFQKSAPRRLITSQSVFNCGKRRSSSFFAILPQNCKMHTKWVQKKAFCKSTVGVCKGWKNFWNTFVTPNLWLKGSLGSLQCVRETFMIVRRTNLFFNCANVPYCSFLVFTITQTTKKHRIAWKRQELTIF